MTVIAHPAPRPLSWALSRRQFLLLTGALLFAAAMTLPSPINCIRHDGDFTNEFSPQDFDVSSVTYRLAWPENAPELVVYPQEASSKMPTYWQIVWPSSN